MLHRVITITITAITFNVTILPAQSGKASRYLSEPFVADSASTLLFPVRYNEKMLSNNKIPFWNEYYANFIVYDFKSDSSRRLFSNDVYILGIEEPSSFRATPVRPKNFTEKWILLLVKDADTNRSRRIDEDDATVLYACTKDGNQLRRLTDLKENVTSLDVKSAFGFALIRVQRDSNHDGSFKPDDVEFYYRKVDLQTLALGGPIEVGQE